jgi:hypothetical protein
MIVTWDEQGENNMRLWIERPGLSAVQFAQQVCNENPGVFSCSRRMNDDSLSVRRVDRIASTVEDWISLFFGPLVEEMIWIIFRHSFVVNALAKCENIRINPYVLSESIETMQCVDDVQRMNLLITHQPARRREYIDLRFEAEGDRHVVTIRPSPDLCESLTTFRVDISDKITQILTDCFSGSPTPNDCTFDFLGDSMSNGLKMRFQRKSDIFAIKYIVLAFMSFDFSS